MALAPNTLADDGEFNDAADIELQWHIDLYDAGLPFRENDGITSSKANQRCFRVRGGAAGLRTSQKVRPFLQPRDFCTRKAGHSRWLDIPTWLDTPTLDSN